MFQSVSSGVNYLTSLANRLCNLMLLKFCYSRRATYSPTSSFWCVCFCKKHFSFNNLRSSLWQLLAFLIDYFTVQSGIHATFAAKVSIPCPTMYCERKTAKGLEGDHPRQLCMLGRNIALWYSICSTRMIEPISAHGLFRQSRE